ncbi:gdt1-like protein 5 [Quercus suber]|uniref:GDT1 family protein n=1 Tax=Quercus suber TaxID=58331 RepID=A0AAW0L0E0_QUESU
MQISRKWTHHITTFLFFGFGLWSLWDGFKDEGEAEELAEVEAKLVGFLTADSHLIYFSRPFLRYLYDLIRVLIGRLTQEHKKNSKDGDDIKKHKRPFLSQFFSPILLKAFSITFFGEWGDKSQLATIGLAADENPFGVVLGGILAPSMVYFLVSDALNFLRGGGFSNNRTNIVYYCSCAWWQELAAQISEKIVALSGGVLFIVFGIQSFLSTVDS